MLRKARPFITGALFTLVCAVGLAAVLIATTPAPHPGNPAVVPVPSPMAPSQ